jgi:hypothetical protein
MALKENSNGNCFEAWLCEYKTRLEQVCVRPSLTNNRDKNVDASNDTHWEQEPNDKAASPPALAGEIYALLQPPPPLALNR